MGARNNHGALEVTPPRQNPIPVEHHGAKRLENLSTPSNEVLSGFTAERRWGTGKGGKREERWKHAGGGNRIS
mgnify:CR=1 FL=1